MGLDVKKPLNDAVIRMFNFLDFCRLFLAFHLFVRRQTSAPLTAVDAAEGFSSLGSTAGSDQERRLRRLGCATGRRRTISATFDLSCAACRLRAIRYMSSQAPTSVDARFGWIKRREFVFPFLRQTSNPNAPRPVEKRGKAAGRGFNDTLLYLQLRSIIKQKAPRHSSLRRERAHGLATPARQTPRPGLGRYCCATIMRPRARENAAVRTTLTLMLYGPIH